MESSKLKTLLIMPETNLKQAMKKLNDTAEKILFVVDEGSRLLGTVTDGDLRRGIISGLKFTDTVERVMHRGFVAVTLETPEMEECARHFMMKHKIEQIPVLDGRGAIVDVVSWTDLLGDEKEAEPGQLHPNHVVIMAGGKGTRLGPFAKILPKPLIPIGDKPVIERIMERFYQHGFHRFVYTLNYKKEYLKLFLSESNFPYSIEWVEEEKGLGTAGSLALLRGKITETFFVTNCDSLLDVNFQEILAWHKEHRASMTIIGCHNEVKIPFGVLEMSNGKLKRILEKPVQDVIINTGVYVLEPHVISLISRGKPLDMHELIGLIGETEKITVYPIQSGWLDIGQWEEYKKTLDHIEGKTEHV